MGHVSNGRFIYTAHASLKNLFLSLQLLQHLEDIVIYSKMGATGL